MSSAPHMIGVYVGRRKDAEDFIEKCRLLRALLPTEPDGIEGAGREGDAERGDSEGGDGKEGKREALSEVWQRVCVQLSRLLAATDTANICSEQTCSRHVQFFLQNLTTYLAHLADCNLRNQAYSVGDGRVSANENTCQLCGGDCVVSSGIVRLVRTLTDGLFPNFVDLSFGLYSSQVLVAVVNLLTTLRWLLSTSSAPSTPQLPSYTKIQTHPHTHTHLPQDPEIEGLISSGLGEMIRWVFDLGGADNETQTPLWSMARHPQAAFVLRALAASAAGASLADRRRADSDPRLTRRSKDKDGDASALLSFSSRGPLFIADGYTALQEGLKRLAASEPFKQEFVQQPKPVASASLQLLLLCAIAPHSASTTQRSGGVSKEGLGKEELGEEGLSKAERKRRKHLQHLQHLKVSEAPIVKPPPSSAILELEQHLFDFEGGAEAFLSVCSTGVGSKHYEFIIANILSSVTLQYVCKKFVRKSFKDLVEHNLAHYVVKAFFKPASGLTSPSLTAWLLESTSSAGMGWDWKLVFRTRPGLLRTVFEACANLLESSKDQQKILEDFVKTVFDTHAVNAHVWYKLLVSPQGVAIIQSLLGLAPRVVKPIFPDLLKIFTRPSKKGPLSAPASPPTTVKSMPSLPELAMDKEGSYLVQKIIDVSAKGAKGCKAGSSEAAMFESVLDLLEPDLVSLAHNAHGSFVVATLYRHAPTPEHQNRITQVFRANKNHLRMANFSLYKQLQLDSSANTFASRFDRGTIVGAAGVGKRKEPGLMPGCRGKTAANRMKPLKRFAGPFDAARGSGSSRQPSNKKRRR